MLTKYKVGDSRLVFFQAIKAGSQRVSRLRILTKKVIRNQCTRGPMVMISSILKQTMHLRKSGVITLQISASFLKKNFLL